MSKPFCRRELLLWALGMTCSVSDRKLREKSERKEKIVQITMLSKEYVSTGDAGRPAIVYCMPRHWEWWFSLYSPSQRYLEDIYTPTRLMVDTTALLPKYLQWWWQLNLYWIEQLHLDILRPKEMTIKTKTYFWSVQSRWREPENLCDRVVFPKIKVDFHHIHSKQNRYQVRYWIFKSIKKSELCYRMGFENIGTALCFRRKFDAVQMTDKL